MHSLSIHGLVFRGQVKPGFYFASCSFVGEDGEVSQRMQLGYAPEKTVSPLTREPDFLDFWKQSHGALKRVEPRFEVIAQPQAGNPQINVYEVRMRSLGNVRVAGWYEVPKKPGRYPAVLRLPGYGQNMRPIGRCQDKLHLRRRAGGSRPIRPISTSISVPGSGTTAE